MYVICGRKTNNRCNRFFYNDNKINLVSNELILIP